MKKILILSFLFLTSCSQANGVDGTYNRVGQTVFEKEKGMSTALVLSNDGRNAVLKNSWGDTDLFIKTNGNQTVVQQNGIDVYKLEVSGKYAILTDIDNPEQKYRFEKGD